MNREPPRRSVLHMLLSVLTRKAPEQGKQHLQPPRRPAPDDHDAWRAYWKEQGQPWRTEPEIDEKRQEYLAERRIVPPDIEHGIYPFKDVKLNRADVEWLLATLDGRGPVDWGDGGQGRRHGLDLRGADLRGAHLNSLPLTRMQGGLKIFDQFSNRYSKSKRDAAAVHLERANLFGTHLEGADLFGAHLEGANLDEAHLEEAYLREVFLEKAELLGSHLEKAHLDNAHLEGANLAMAHLDNASLTTAHLEDADLFMASLKGANLRGAYLEGVLLREAHLESANLGEAHLEKADIREAHMEGVNLKNIILSDERHVGPQLADVRWGDVNLTVVKWSQVQMLGDEYQSRQKKRGRKLKNRSIRRMEYEEAARANRQLAIVLQAQGFRRDPVRFAYRAEVLEKHVFWLEMIQHGMVLRRRIQALGFWLFSWFLYLLAGYGYKPLRSFLAYLLVIGIFMGLYLLLNPHLAWYEALVVSMTAFHGRGFSPSTFTPGDPVSIASAVEALVGLIIEVTFIATLTRRFFGQ